ncbi:MAG TPA: hypothetical protein VFB60_11185 [Ktedonobacteraceae bacterium]|nr:hypothetical protein [Ktedonobacteraceae bacterium]
MSRDTRASQPPINLEVTVPRILLPAIDEEQGSKETGNSHEELERVHLLSIDIQDPRRPPQSHEQPQTEGEASNYTSWQGLFRLFQIKNIPLQHWATLVQVLRKSGKRAKMEVEGFQVTENLPCKIEYHAAGANSPLHIEVIPGLTRVVIVLDEDGIPITCNVDGAEN